MSLQRRVEYSTQEDEAVSYMTFFQRYKKSYLSPKYFLYWLTKLQEVLDSRIVLLDWGTVLNLKGMIVAQTEWHISTALVYQMD